MNERDLANVWICPECGHEHESSDDLLIVESFSADTLGGLCFGSLAIMPVGQCAECNAFVYDCDNLADHSDERTQSQKDKDLLDYLQAHNNVMRDALLRLADLSELAGVAGPSIVSSMLNAFAAAIEEQERFHYDGYEKEGDYS